MLSGSIIPTVAGCQVTHPVSSNRSVGSSLIVAYGFLWDCLIIPNLGTALASSSATRGFPALRFSIALGHWLQNLNVPAAVQPIPGSFWMTPDLLCNDLRLDLFAKMREPYSNRRRA